LTSQGGLHEEDRSIDDTGVDRGLRYAVVTATLVGATPGAEHPWHIHLGTCDNDEGIFGDPAAYPHLQVGAAGQATAMATLVATLQAGASYFVNVHASAEDLATIVACGELTRQ
jgi:hypothetical protein